MHYNGKSTVLNHGKYHSCRSQELASLLCHKGKQEWKHSGFYSDRPLCCQLHEEQWKNVLIAVSEVEVVPLPLLLRPSLSQFSSSARRSKYWVRLRLSVLLRHCWFFLSLLTEMDLAALTSRMPELLITVLSINPVLVAMRWNTLSNRIECSSYPFSLAHGLHSAGTASPHSGV